MPYRELAEWPIDIDWWMRWHEAGLRARKTAERAYLWRQHPAQAPAARPIMSFFHSEAPVRIGPESHD